MNMCKFLPVLPFVVADVAAPTGGVELQLASVAYLSRHLLCFCLGPLPEFEYSGIFPVEIPDEIRPFLYRRNRVVNSINRIGPMADFPVKAPP